MRLLNVRYGFANNSSSSHSVILLKGLQDREADEDFQWNAFTLASEEAKLRYLAAQVAHNSPREVVDGGGWAKVDVANPVYRDLMAQIFGRPPTQEELTRFAEGIVDHQSVWALPRDFRGNPHPEFVRQLRAALVKEDVAILGGNDNGGTHPNYGDGPELLGFIGRESYPCRARYDAERDFWTLFDPRTGFKSRFSFELQGTRRELRDNPPSYEKASTPELVDVKITGYCTAGCAYCYQSSTARGQHAPLARVKAVAEALSKLQVFEVALGGGEPTEHPDFLEILQTFAAQDIKPNFTTKSLRWLESPKAKDIVQTMGSMAISVETAEDVQAALAALTAAGINERGPRFSVQHVVGVSSAETFRGVAIASALAGFRLTLLGYKTVGFGKRVQPHAFSWPREIMEAVKALDGARQLHGTVVGTVALAIDTALAQQSKAELEAMAVPHWMYHVNEGAFSMYIDAVKSTAAASSYEGKPEPVELTADAILARFATF